MSFLLANLLPPAKKGYRIKSENLTIWYLDAETLGPRAPPSEHKIVNMPYWN